MDQKKTKLTPTLAILEEALKVWWKNLKQIVRVYLWGILFTLLPPAIVLLFFSLLFVLMSQFVDMDSYQRVNSAAIFAVFFLLSMLFSLYFSIRTYIAFFLLVKRDYQGEPLKIFKETKEFFWSYFGLAVLTAVLILLWSFLFIIPGIVYSVFYSFAIFVFFFEGQRGMAAIRRSRDLVKGYFWPVFGRLLLIGLFLYLLNFLLFIPSKIFMEDGVWLLSLLNSLAQIINFLIGPIVLIFMYRIYQDLVAIKKS